MSETLDRDLYDRATALLEPGDIDLEGVIVHTDLGGDEDLEMQELTVELNDVIADHADAGETFIYAGNENPEFSSNQFQGRTVDDEAFVWECQQLLRDGTFDLVFYFEADADTEAIADDVEAMGHDATVVP